MRHPVTIPGGPFSDVRRDALAGLLQQAGGVEPEEAALAVLLAPVEVTVRGAEARDRLLGALARAGFEASAGAPIVEAAPAVDPSGAEAPARLAADRPTAPSRAITVVAAVLALVVVGLIGVVIGQSRSGQASGLPIVADAPPEATPAASLPAAMLEPEPPRPKDDAPGAWTSGPLLLSAETSGTVTLRGFRTGGHAGFDRVVFEFEGTKLPAVRVTRGETTGYVCETDSWFDAGGTAALSVSFAATVESGAWGPDVPGVERACGGGFGMDAVYVVGLDRPQPYRTLVLRDPLRLVLDIQTSS